MQIKRINSNTLEVSDGEVYVAFTLAESFTDSKYDTVLGPKLDNFMSSPGEYEYKDISITVIESAKRLQGVGNLYILEVDGVGVGFVTHDIDVSSIDKKMLDSSGDIHILFVPEGISKTDAKKLNNDLAPRYVLGLDIIDEKQVSELLDFKTSFNDKKLNLEKKDIVGDEYITIAGVLV